VIRLADGQQIEVRPIRPEDRRELAEGMRRLSPESRYRRFFSLTEQLSEDELDYLTKVDHHDHEALVARDLGTGLGIGVARYVRAAPGSEVAELGIAVADDWQGRGVGTALLRQLSDRAREEGVRRFSALILDENRPMLDLIDDLGDVHVKGHDFGSVELEVELPEAGSPPALREAMRRVARGVLRFSPLARPDPP
jgi:RimJ/RimL family protein N-acetyltransferase